MNERIKELAEQAGLKVESWMTNPPTPFQILGSTEQFEKFAELIVRECAELNRKQSWDLTGVIIDVEESTGFDEVCMNTVKRVKNYLAGNDLLKHFGVEE